MPLSGRRIARWSYAATPHRTLSCKRLLHREAATSEPFLSLQLGDVRWQVASEWLPRLFAEEGPIWESAGRIIKQAKHRWVRKVEDSQGGYYVKCYCTTKLADFWRHCLRASPAKREWQNLQRLHACGVPSLRPVALGERFVHGVVRENYLITEGIPDTQPLDEYLLGEAQLATQRAWLQQPLAELLAKCHEAGVDHRDFHAGNVLVRCPDAQTAGEVFLIDLPNVRWSRGLNWSQTCKSLAMFFSGVADLSTATEQRACLQAYRQLRSPGICPPPREMLPAIHRQTAKHTHRILRKQDRRCFRQNERFQVQQFEDARVVAVADCPLEDLQRWYPLASKSRVRCADQHRNGLKPAPSRTTNPQGEHSPADQPRHGSRSAQRTLPEAWQWFSCRRDARRIWQQAHALLLRRVPTRRPLALWEFSARQAAIVWEELPELVAWEDVCSAENCPSELGSLLGRLHRWGMLHGQIRREAIGWRKNANRPQALWTEIATVTSLPRPSEARFKAEVAQMLSLFPSQAAVATLCRSYLKARGKLPQFWAEYAG